MPYRSDMPRVRGEKSPSLPAIIRSNGFISGTWTTAWTRTRSGNRIPIRWASSSDEAARGTPALRIRDSLRFAHRLATGRERRNANCGSSPEMNLVLFIWLLVVVVVWFWPSFPALRAGERSEPARSAGKENFISIFPGAAMHLLRGSHSQGRVRPAVVIQMDSAMGRLAGLQVAGKICVQPV